MTRKIIILLLWIIGILSPIAWMSGFHPGLQTWFNKIFSPAWVHYVMHMLLFAVLSIIVESIIGRQLFRTMIIILLIGMIQEGIQMIGVGRLPGRGEILDMCVDVVGALIGVGITRLFHRWQNNRTA